MRHSWVALIVSTSIIVSPVYAADRMKFGKDEVVIDGKNAFVNGKKVSCADLAKIGHIDWGKVFIDENCVRHKLRFVGIYRGFLKTVYTEGQWLYRPRNNDPVAVFMNWEYSRVAFRFQCEFYTDMSVVYHGDGNVKLKRGDSMTLLLDERPYKLSVEFNEDALVGMIKLTTTLKMAISQAKEVKIAAPNVVDEPWYMGQAPALKRLVRECKY